MPTSSVVVPFKRALVAHLTVALPTKQVAYVWPGPDTAESGIFLGPDTPYRQELANLGPARSHRDEEFEVPVICQDYAGAAADEVEAAVAALFAEVETCMATRPAPVLEAAGVASWQWSLVGTSQLFTHGKGWACRNTAALTVRARLT